MEKEKMKLLSKQLYYFLFLTLFDLRLFNTIIYIYKDTELSKKFENIIKGHKTSIQTLQLKYSNGDFVFVIVYNFNIYTFLF